MSRDPSSYLHNRKRGDASPLPDAEVSLTPLPNPGYPSSSSTSLPTATTSPFPWQWSAYFSPSASSGTNPGSTSNNNPNDPTNPNPTHNLHYIPDQSPSLIRQCYSRIVILPNNRVRKLWEFWSAIVILYTSIAVPFIVFFNVHIEVNSPLYIWEAIVYASFVIDLILAFFCARVGSEGQLITDPSLIITHYLRTWFIIDVVAILPFQFLSVETIGTSSSSLSRLTRIPRMLQLLRLVRLAKVFGLMRVIARALKQNLTPAYSRLSMTVLGSLIMIHVLTCLWWFVGSENLLNGLPNWIVTKGLEHTNLSDAYVTSMYYILCTISTLGPGDIIPVHFNERIYAILLIGIGSVWFGTIVYSVSAFLEEIELANRAAYDKRRHLLAFARHHKLDSVLTARMVASFDTVSAKRAADDAEGIADETGEAFGVKMDYNADLVLSSVSPEMREELILAAKRKELERFPALQNQPKRVQAYILQHLHEAVALDGEIIGAEGDHAEFMYFIASGKVDLTLDGKTIASYGPGAIIGEIDCMFSTSRIATIQASGKCHYFTLTREHLHHICERIPEFSDWLHIIAAHRVKQYESVSKTRLPVSDQLHAVIDELASPKIKGRNGSVVGLGKMSRAHSSLTSLTDALGPTGSENGSMSDSANNTVDSTTVVANNTNKSSFLLNSLGLNRGNSKRAAVVARANVNTNTYPTVPTPEVAPWAALEANNRKAVTPAGSGMDGIEPLRAIQANHEMRAMGSVTALTFALSNMFAGGVGSTIGDRSTGMPNRRRSIFPTFSNNSGGNTNSKISILEMMAANNRKNAAGNGTTVGPERTDSNSSNNSVPVINLPSSSSLTSLGGRPPSTRGGSIRNLNNNNGGRSAPPTPSLTGQSGTPSSGTNATTGIFSISPPNTSTTATATNIPRNESGNSLSSITIPQDIVVSIPHGKTVTHTSGSLGYQRHTASGFIPSEAQIPELSLMEETPTPMVAKTERDLPNEKTDRTTNNTEE